MQEVNAFYNLPGGRTQSDTLTYTYDNSPWFPEAVYLYQVKDLETGKPNKNNITGIHLKKAELSQNDMDVYESMQYTYSVKGNRLEKVMMTGTAKLGVSASSTIAFAYKCK